MNRRQKELQQQFLDNEKAVLKQLEKNYQEALNEINRKIELLMARQDADMQHVIYRIEYQKALRTQVQAILEQLQNKEFETLSEFLTGAYEDGFVGAMYDMQGQGVPLVFPIDQEQVIAAIQHETKLSSPLYTELGKDIKVLGRQISAEISRGITMGAMYSEMARNIASYANIPKNRAMVIARTEAHRIQCAATANAQWKAKEKGADVVKMWDSTLDGRTRHTHRELDGQIRELDEEFEVAGKKAMYPGNFGDPAEDCNCRCTLLQRARWALDRDITKWANGEGLVTIKAKDYQSFKKEYFRKVDEAKRVREGSQMMKDDIIQRLKDKGVVVDIEGAGKHKEEANQALQHLEVLLDEYDSTTVSYTVTNNSLTSNIAEGGAAYMLNGKTSIAVKPSSFKKLKATDHLHLGDKQHLGLTYHEFAHSLSQSREKTDSEFWKEIRKIKREYEAERGKDSWFDVKISDYASKDVDEFLAEAFAQAKLSDNPSIFAKKVLAVVDKYFKKTPLANGM